jgi:hypothetical protein
MNNTKRFNIIDADRVSYRTLSLGSMDRISFRDQISPLQNRCGNIRGSIAVSIAGESALLADKQSLSYPVSLFSMPTSGTSLRGMPWINSIDFNSISQSYAIQSMEELAIRYSANQSINFSTFAISELSSSSQMFEVLDVNVGIILNSQTNNLKSYLPTSSVYKVALIPLEFSQGFDCFTASFALEFASPIANLMLHDSNISTQVELIYNPSIRVSNTQSTKVRRTNVYSNCVRSDFRIRNIFLHDSLNDVFTISFEQEQTIEDITLRFNLFESFESVIPFDWQNYSFSAKRGQSNNRVSSWCFFVSKEFVCEPDWDTLNHFCNLTPVPSSDSCRDNIIGRELIFSPNTFVSSMMQSILGDAYV